jgi:homoserine dehydrogenase
MASTPIAEQDGRPEPFCTAGTSPTRTGDDDVLCLASPLSVHLIGPGAVGQQLLKRMARLHCYRLVAITDSTGTLEDAQGLDPLLIARVKAMGRGLSSHGTSNGVSVVEAVAQAGAQLVIDTTATRFDRPDWTRLADGVLARGACWISAAKDAWCAAGARWLKAGHKDALGLNAVLGGTGERLLAQLEALQTNFESLALAGSASTTMIIEQIETGATFDQGVAAAKAAGVLEPDPELDLTGVDAAVKLAIVVGLLQGRALRPEDIDVEDIRALDPQLIAQRARRGETTRLVGRYKRGAPPTLRYEAVARDATLAVEKESVVYCYRDRAGGVTVHQGDGIGARATAKAVLVDMNQKLQRSLRKKHQAAETL